MEVFSDWTEPNTYNALFETFADHDFRIDEEDTNRLRSVVAFLTRMRQACAENVSLDVVELTRLFAVAESVGVRGWYLLLQRQKALEQLCIDFQHEVLVRDQEFKELKEKNRELEAETNELNRDRCTWWNKLQENAQDLSQYGDTEAVRQLTGVVKRLEPLIDQFQQLVGARVLVAHVSPPSRPGTLSDIDEDEDEIQLYGSGWGDTDLLLMQEQSSIEDTQTWGSSSVVAEVGSFLDNPATSYPPPLALATEEARRADEKKMNMLSEVEHTLWIQESKDREYFVKRPGPPPRVPLPPPSSRFVESNPFYIYIPLPSNFTIPQSNPRLPSLTFPTPSSVFHFPDSATRDQLFVVLRKVSLGGTGDEHLEPLDEINVIRVRTHELEWELKNAIRRIMTEGEWDSIVGNDWSTEGQGDTYIVSKRDVQFYRFSDESKAGSQRSSSGARSEDSEENSVKRSENNGDRGEDCCEIEQPNKEEQDDIPQLRGGTLSPFPNLTSSPLSGLSYSDHSPRNLGQYCETNISAPIYEDDSVEHLQAWIEQARILQLQNTSHRRMIDHLLEIIKDTEDTVQWQDEELSRAHRRIEDLERKVRERKDESLAAGRKAELAKAEIRILQGQLQQIHDQVVQFCEELDAKEQHILEQYPGLSTSGSSKTAELRGGGVSRSGTGDSSPLTNPTDPVVSRSQIVEASSFYFFPSVSMVILLSNPLHHFQFPKHTSLAQVRQLLQERYFEGREVDPHLRQVREILEARDEAGIRLPDTCNGRQILISAPEIKDDAASIASGKPGYKGKWNRTFGPSEYRYESMLKDSIESLEPPNVDERSVLSPTVSAYEDKFHDTGVLIHRISSMGSPDESEFYNAGDLIDTIEREAEVSRARSCHKLPYTCKEIPQSRNRADSLGERRGYTISLPLPPNTLGPMFPTGRLVKFDYEQDLSNNIRTGGSRSSREYSFANHDNDTNMAKKREDRALGGVGDPNEGWGMWRHPKGEGCEDWMTPYDLDPTREHCALCGLPFLQTSCKKWKFDADATPTGNPQGSDNNANAYEGRQEDRCKSKHSPPNPYLRGGAEELEWKYLQDATYDAVSLGWADEISSEHPVSPGMQSLSKGNKEEAELPVYYRRQRVSERPVLEKRVRFAPSEKSPTLRGGYAPLSNPPQIGKGKSATRTLSEREALRKKLAALRREIKLIERRDCVRLDSCKGHVIKGKVVDHKDKTNSVIPNRNSPSCSAEYEGQQKRPISSPQISASACNLAKGFPLSPTGWSPTAEVQWYKWVPETLAGPSEIRGTVKSGCEREEYDGMMWVYM